MPAAINISVLMTSQSFWETVEYVLSGFVALGCFGEFVHECTSWFRSYGLWEEKGGVVSAVLLVAALAIEIPTQFKVNSISAQIIGALSREAATDRLDTERMRNANLILEKEIRGREISPEQWKAVLTALKGKVTEDIAVYIAPGIEPHFFGLSIAALLQDVGMSGKIAFLPEPAPEQTGVMFCGDGSKDSALISAVLMDQGLVGVSFVDIKMSFGQRKDGTNIIPKFCPPSTIFVGFRRPQQDTPPGTHRFTIVDPW